MRNWGKSVAVGHDNHDGRYGNQSYITRWKHAGQDLVQSECLERTQTCTQSNKLTTTKYLWPFLNVLRNGDTPLKLYRWGHIYWKHSTILNRSFTPILLYNEQWETPCTLCLTTTPHHYQNLACNLALLPTPLNNISHCTPTAHHRPHHSGHPHSLHWKHWSKKRPHIVQ